MKKLATIILKVSTVYLQLFKKLIMKNIYTLLLILGFAVSNFAQSDILFTHFAFNKLAYNPGYTGAKGAFDVTAIYRNQWSALDGAPQTSNLNIQFPFADKKNAVGVSFTSDEIGMLNTNAVDLSYAYKLKLNDSNTLSLGLQGRIEQARINWTSASAVDSNDGSIPTADETTYTPNFGFGIYLKGKDYFAGLSAPRLLKNALYLDQNDNGGVSRASITTYYFMAGIVKSVAKDIKVAPSFLVSYNPTAPVDVDLNVNVFFFDAFWIGGSYRLSDSFDGLIGYQFKNGVRLGVALDYTTSELDKLTKGSFEIMAGYTFRCKDCNVNHLRYF